MVLDVVQFSVFVVFCIAFGFIGFAKLRMGRTSDGPLENKLFLYAFIIRCVAAVLIFQALIYFHGIPFLSYGNDDFSYHQRAFELASEWATGDWFYPTYHAAAYDSMVAMIYLIFGPVPLVIRALHCLAGAMTAVFTFRVGTYCFGRAIGRRAAILIVVLPDMIFWSAVQYRDMLLAVLIMYLVWFAIRRHESTNRFKDFVIPVLALGAYVALDLFGAAILASCLAAHMWLNSEGPKQSLVRRSLVAAAMVCVMGGLIWFGNSVRDEQANLGQIMTLGQGRTYSLMEESASGSLSNVFLNQDNIFIQAAVAPLRFVFPLFLPFPSRSPAFEDVILFSGSIMWYLAIPLAVYGLTQCLMRRARNTFLLYAIPFFSLVGIYVLFYSGSGRYRMRFMPLLWILAAIGMADFKKLRLIYVIPLSMIVMAFIAYLMIKAGL